MMTSGSNMIIVAYIGEDGQESVIQKTKHMKAIGEGTKNYLLTKLSYDVEEQRFDQTNEIPESMIIKACGGLNRIYSLLKHSANSFIVCYGKQAFVFDVDTMNQLKTVDVNTSVDFSYHTTPLLFNNFVPDTDLKFMLELYDPQFIKLRTVETGTSQILIQGSPVG